jgi:hypothetical protein
MKYFLYQLVIYIVFIAVSKAQTGENKPARTTVLAAVIGLVFLVISFFVEFPLRLIPFTILMENKWLYLTVVLATDLAKIAIPFSAVLCMSALFGNIRINKLIIIISVMATIVSLAMVTYETMAFISTYNQLIGGELPFFTAITGGPMSAGFGRIILISELAPAVLQTIVTLVKKDTV